MMYQSSVCDAMHTRLGWNSHGLIVYIISVSSLLGVRKAIKDWRLRAELYPECWHTL